MKCPERFTITQQNIRNPILNDDNIVVGEYHLLIETQQFPNCYEEECVCWDKEKKKCRKVGG